MYRSVRSDWPCDVPHLIVVVDMPGAEDIIRTMQECFAEAQYKSTSTVQAVSTNPSQADGWLTGLDEPESAKPPTSHSTHQSQLNPSEHNESTPTTRNQHHSEESFMPETLGHGDIGLDQIFDPPHDQSGDRNDVDDITAALSSAQDTEFALSQIDDAFLTSTLDPTLHDAQVSTANHTEPVDISAVDLQKDLETFDEHTSKAEKTGESATAQVAGTGPQSVSMANTSDPEVTPPSLQLLAPQAKDTKIEMVPLPIVLVRQSDGVGFGIGRSVVAERVDSKEEGQVSARWGQSFPDSRWPDCYIRRSLADGCAGLRVVSD